MYFSNKEICTYEEFLGFVKKSMDYLGKMPEVAQRSMLVDMLEVYDVEDQY